jgi:hypothetical protein
MFGRDKKKEEEKRKKLEAQRSSSKAAGSPVPSGLAATSSQRMSNALHTLVLSCVLF